MSQPMNNAKEIVEKIIEKLGKDNHKEQLQNIDKLIDQNKGKIWLRTRSGKPMAEKMETTATKVMEMLNEGSDINETLDELMKVAKEIDEESQRRSMVVT